MKILLVGNGQFYHIASFFRQAIVALGHSCAFFDEHQYFAPLQTSLIHKIGFRLLGKQPLTYWALNKQLVRLAEEFQPDLLLTTNGSYIADSTLTTIKQKTGAILATYVTDDPFNQVNTTHDFVNNIPLYDFYFCTKRRIMPDIERAGAQRIVFVPFGYEPKLHHPEAAQTSAERDMFESDVVFIGSGDVDRYPYMESIANTSPIKLHLYGGYWQQHPQLRSYYRGFALGRDFRLALTGTKIAPCLVRQANRDGHVMRTFEVPACKAFMLAERTDEHMEFLSEDKECVFFSTPDELLDKVQYYLKHPLARERIAQAGFQRIVINGENTYQDRLAFMLHQVQKDYKL